MRVQIGYKTERGGGEHAALSSVAKRCLTPRLGQRVADGGASRTCTQMRLTVHRNVQSRERSLQTLEDRSRRLSTEECRHPRATCAHSTPHTRTHARTHARAPLAAVSSALKVRILQAKLHRQTRKEQRPESTNAPPLKVLQMYRRAWAHGHGTSTGRKHGSSAGCSHLMSGVVPSTVVCNKDTRPLLRKYQGQIPVAIARTVVTQPFPYLRYSSWRSDSWPGIGLSFVEHPGSNPGWGSSDPVFVFSLVSALSPLLLWYPLFGDPASQ